MARIDCLFTRHRRGISRHIDLHAANGVDAACLRDGVANPADKPTTNPADNDEKRPDQANPEFCGESPRDSQDAVHFRSRIRYPAQSG